MVGRSDLLSAAAAATPSSSGYWRSYCPFCEESEGYTGKQNFTIRMATGQYWCWRCAEKGTIRNIGEALFAVVEAAKVAEDQADDVTPPDFEPPDGYVALAGPGSDRVKFRPARNYLASRFVTPRAISECQIGAVVDRHHRYSRSVVVPILDRGVWRGYVCRRYTGRGYLYPRGMKRGELFFNMDALTAAGPDPIFLVEGCFDALPHYPHAVACLGKPSHTHVEMLRRVTRPIAIVLDADAQREGWALAQRLRLDGVDATFVKLPAGSDPGDLPTDWLLSKVLGSFNG